tara:strand:- start:134 stop:943 length:810 start_codon:yes stop_codon:yes gene_type:complete
MNVVFYDAYNLIYRARHALPRAMQESKNGISFAFYRSFAALNRKLQPDMAYFVTEGKPVQRLNLLPEYKGTRAKNTDMNFSRQRNEIISMISDYFPVTVVNHPMHECDDIIAHLVKKHSAAGDDVTVVSTDTDFLQLANSVAGFKQYDPIRKKYKDLPEHDYVSWKALTGDSSDNIIGFKGIGNKRALNMLENPSKLHDFLYEGGNAEKFKRNKELISFIDVSNDENMITFTSDESNWDKVFQSFEEMEFRSIISEKGWKNFLSAFDSV